MHTFTHRYVFHRVCSCILLHRSMLIWIGNNISVGAYKLYFILCETSSYIMHIMIIIIIYLYRIGLTGRTCGVGSHVHENSDYSVTRCSTTAVECWWWSLAVVVVVLKSVTQKHIRIIYGKWQKKHSTHIRV
jgi:hypothetical protein